MENFKIGDKVVIDLRYYSDSDKGKLLDYQVINKIGVTNGNIELINTHLVGGVRLATSEEIKKYF